jgi:hypothetical protein
VGVAQKAEVILGDRLINCVHSLTEEQIPVSFRALLTLNTFAFDGITVTDVTEVHESGPLSEKDEILNPYLEQNYLLSEYHVDFRMTAVWHVSFDTLLRPAHDGYDAYGNAFVITGRQEPYSDLDTIATIAYELEIASLYDSLGSPPSPNVFLPPATTSTSLERSFSSSSWDEIGRVSYGNRGLPAPPTSSSADFIDGVVPSASWNEYWFQAEEVLPTGTVETKKTFILHAKQTDKNGAVTEGYGTVTFAIRESKDISDAEPVVEGLEALFTSWVEAKGDGTLLVKPPVERGKRNVVDLLPVEIKEAWSDQIKDVEANGMPDKTGNNNKAYIFMGARNDGKGHGKLRLGSALPGDIRNKVLWRFAKNGTENPEQGSSTYEEEGKVVRVTLDNPPNADDKDFVVVFGFDENEDGNLSQSEVMGTPETMHDPPGGGVNPTSMPFTFKIVGQARYDEALEELLNSSQSSAIRGAVPNAADLLQSFCEKKTPANATAEATTVERNETGLTHPLGIAFTPQANPGQSITAVYGKDHLLMAAFLESTQFWNWLNGKLVEKTEEVRNHFHGLPLTETEHTFHWAFGNGDLNFNNTTDFDCWMALGHAKMGSISVKAKVNRQFLTLENLEVSGTAVDIYDFDYDGLGFTIPGFLGFGGAKVESYLGAELQSGYPTLGDGGRVYKHRIEMQDSDVPLPEHAFRFDPPL